MKGAFLQRVKEGAAKAKASMVDSELAAKAKDSSQKLIKKASDIADEKKIKKRGTIVRKILDNFDWVKYNEDFFRNRRKDRDGLLAIPKEAWTTLIGRRRRVLKKVERSGSAAKAQNSEFLRGAAPGVVVGGVGTAMAAGAIGIVAAPLALIGGATVGALVLGSRSERKALNVISSMKDNERRMADIFDGIIASIASRYTCFGGNEEIQLSSGGHFENQWGSLGADTVSSSFGDMSMWASSSGIRIRVKAAIADVTSSEGWKTDIQQRFFLMPSLVDFVLVNELGTFPVNDIEAVAAMVTILSSPRGHKVRNHMRPMSSRLLKSPFGSPHIKFHRSKAQCYENLVCNLGVVSTYEKDEKGQTVARVSLSGDCLMPL